MKAATIKTVSTGLMAVLVTLSGSAIAGDEPPAGVSRRRPLLSVQSDYSPAARPHYYYAPYAPRAAYFWRGGATPAGSYARGLAALSLARGHYNRLTAQARVIHAEARRREIENREVAAESYFAMRQANRQSQASAARPRPSPAQLAQRAKQALPDRLERGQLDAKTGELSWPILLQTDRFADFRTDLQRTFSQRAAQRGLKPPQRLRAGRTTDAMAAELKKLVRQAAPHDYIEAHRFLESLAHEVRLLVI